MKFFKENKDDFRRLVVLVVCLFLAKLVTIQIPGLTGVKTNLAEIPLLIGVFYFRRFWYLPVLIVFGVFFSFSEKIQMLSFVPHLIALLSVRFIYYKVHSHMVQMHWHIAFWILLAGLYYVLFLLPVFVVMHCLFGYGSCLHIWMFYNELLFSFRFEIVVTLIVTALFLAQYLLKKALEKHLNEVEAVVEKRTEELASAMDELQAANEELQTTNYALQNTNEELSEMNLLVKQKNDELNITLMHLEETQHQLFQVEKMASLGTLTAGVAHEINNPLNFIRGAQLGLEDYFKKQGSADSAQTDFLQNCIHTGIERISGIVKGLNQFSRNTASYDETCDIHGVLESCLLMLNFSLKEKIDVEKEFAPGTLLVSGNVGKLHQVFINLLDNAIQAIKDQGHIKIKTAQKGSRVMVEVIDNGSGIAKENLPYVVDPFFTTKPPGQGTGLGLSITYSIVKDHKGVMEIESEVDKGTRVIVTLPVKQSEA